MLEFDLRIPAHREAVGGEAERIAKRLLGGARIDLLAYAEAVKVGTLQDVLAAYGGLGPTMQRVAHGVTTRGIAQVENRFAVV